MTTTLYVPPQHKLDFSKIQDYTSILKYFSKQHILYYTYTFEWVGRDIMKHGISYKNGTKRPLGDRAYTQAGYIPGWNKDCLKRGPKSKEAMDELIKTLENMYGGKLVKDNVILTIDDYTNYKFSNPTDIYPELQNIEERMKNNYFIKHNRFPVGNKKQEKIRYVPDISTGVFDFGDY